MTQDELLVKNKYLFIVPTVLLASIALWHLLYVRSAVAETGDSFLYGRYMMISVAWTGIAAAAGIIMICMGGPRPCVWAGFSMLMGLAVMQVMPGLSAADEPVHYISAYTISNQMMGTTVRDEQGRVYLRAEDFRLEDLNGESEDYRAGLASGTKILGHDLDESTYRDIENWKKGLITDDEMRSTDIVGVVTTPVVYIPQALGITLARVLHLNALFTVNLGRFFNLLTYTLIIYAALMITPVGRELMMAVGALPITIELSASFSYDAMLIALCWLYTALVLRTAYDEKPVSGRRMLTLAAVIGILAPCKMVYSILILLLLMIPAERFKSKGQMLLCWGICAAAVALGMYLVNSQVIASYASAEESTLVWAGEEGWTLRRCLHEPVRMARMFYDTLMRQGNYYFTTLLGGYLGNADPGLDVPFVYLLIMAACLFMLALKREGEDAQSSCTPRTKLIIAVVCLLLICMLLGSMLIGWTPLSSGVILGVHGRYLLPVLPLMLLLIGNDTVVVKKDMSARLLYMIICCDAAAFIRLFAMVCLNIS